MNEACRTGLAGPAAPSDAAIIERSVAVPECFAEIFDRHAEGIYRYAARRLGQQAAADVMSCLTLPHSNWYWKANCPNLPAYVTTLPRTVKAMKRVLLRSAATGQGTPPAAGAIMGIVSDTYQFLVPHRASALMFQALSQMQGMRVIGHATTLAGRKGIAVAAYDPSRGTLDELIFDPKTYLYIGDSQIALNSTSMPKGTVNGNAVLRIAVVGEAGQLP